MNQLLVLQARAEARALLFKCCEYEDLGHAITPLLIYAHLNGLDGELTWGIVRAAFKDAGVPEEALTYGE
jgi:hypothetical protein